METIKRRQDFVAAARSRYWAMPGLTVQARNRGDGFAPRVGVTATRKLGSAVIRNRIKRRLRALARLVLAPGAQEGFDYVLIGRQPALRRPFSDLRNDLESALKRLHGTPHLAADREH